MDMVFIILIALAKNVALELVAYFCQIRSFDQQKDQELSNKFARLAQSQISKLLHPVKSRAGNQSVVHEFRAVIREDRCFPRFPINKVGAAIDSDILAGCAAYAE